MAFRFQHCLSGSVYIFIFLFFFSFTYGKAQNKNYQIEDLYYYQDVSGIQDLNDIINNQFQPASSFPSETIQNGDVYWISFRITGKSNPQTPVVLEFKNWAYVYLYKNDKESQKTGFLVPFKDRDFPFLNKSYIEVTPSADSQLLYAKVVASSNYVEFLEDLSIDITSQTEIYSQFRENHYVRVFNNGFLLCLLIFLLFLYFLIKDPSFLYCSFYVAFSIYTNLNNSGEIVEILSFIDVFPRYVALMDIWVTAGTMISAIITIFYILDFDTNFPKEKQAFNILMIIYFIISAIAVFIPNKVYMVMVMYASLLPGVLGIFYITYHAIKRKIKYATIFTIANVPFIIGAVYYILNEVGIELPFGRTDHFMILGTFIQSFLFAMIFSLRFNTLVKQNEEKQKEIIQKYLESELLSEKWKAASMKAETLEAEKAISQYELLKNQISPHFLFNSLSALTQIVYENKERAANFIHELANVYRYILDNRNQSVISLEDELAGLQSYLYLIKMRFPDSFQVHISLSEENKNTLVPPLILQMLIENAIKHNIASASEPLIIKIFTEEDYLVIFNNLKERKQPAIGTKVGINNIKSRFKVHTDKEVKVVKTQDFFEVRLPILNYD